MEVLKPQAEFGLWGDRCFSSFFQGHQFLLSSMTFVNKMLCWFYKNIQMFISIIIEFIMYTLRNYYLYNLFMII